MPKDNLSVEELILLKIPEFVHRGSCIFYKDFEKETAICDCHVLAEAKAKLNQYYLREVLELMGPDEELGSRPPALDGAAWEEYTTKEHRNELRAVLRQALNNKFNKEAEG